MMEPAVKGTMNVLQACSAANVHRLILVSSLTACFFNPGWPQDKIKDESCWSDKEFCKENEVSTKKLMLINTCTKRLKSIINILSTVTTTY
jgi:nucleoside-diphosphate-sugar epimerase